MGATTEQIIEGILSRQGSNSDSLVIYNHLAQMKLFGIRQGIELLPFQDLPGERKKLIDRVYAENQVDLNLDRWWDLMLCRGQLCFYLRPSGNSYRFYAYEKDQFKAYYDGDGNLLKVNIVYDFEVESPTYLPQRRWIKLEISREKIVRYESEQRLSPNGLDQYGLQPISVVDNTLGVVPCVVVNNYVLSPGQQGVSEFAMLSNQIEGHDRILEAIRENIQFFGNPTLVSTRNLGELTEAGFDTGVQSRKPTLSSASGFYSAATGAYAGGRPGATRQGREYNGVKEARIKRVVGNVGNDERFGYISPDPVSPDHARYAESYRNELHNALGGVDPSSISAGATAFEVKSLFGRAAATALKKCQHIYTHGLCKIFELIIYAEELMAKKALADLMNQQTPPSPTSPFWSAELLDDRIVQQILATGKLPNGKALPPGTEIPGLPPGGDRKVNWRWLGPVFEDSPQDILQKSIVVRNLEEVGVETVKALEYLFSEKTERERMAMLTGYPFREMNQSGAALSQQLGILGQMAQTPNPLTGQPLAASLNNLNAIERTIQHIDKRLSYGLQSSDAEPISSSFSASATANAANGSAATPVLPAGAGSPSAAVPTDGAGYSNGGVPNPITSPAAAGGIPAFSLNNPGANQPGAGSGGFAPDLGAPLPAPGATIAASELRSGGSPVSAASVYGSPTVSTGIPADLLDRPWLLAGIAPGLAAGQREPNGAQPPVASAINNARRSSVTKSSRRSDSRK